MGDYTQGANTYGTMYRSTSSGGDNANVRTPIGISTNSANSGIVGTVARNSFSCKFCIKY